MAAGSVEVMVRRTRQVTPALFDQVLSSGTQFLAAVLIARVSSASLFGVASAVLLVQGLVLGTVRALVGDIVLLRCRRPGAAVQHEASLGVGMAGSLGLAYAGLLGLVGLVAGGDLGRLLLVLAVVMPFGASQDVLRSIAYGRQRVMDAVWLDSTWLIVQVATSVVLFVTDRATATTLLLAWGAGAVASALAGVVVGRVLPSLRGVRSWLRHDGRRSVGFLADYLVSTGVIIVADLALGLILPLAEYGALRLARLGISPLVNLIAGVRSLMLGRLAESAGSPRTVRRVAVSVGRMFALAMVMYGLLLTLMPVWVGEALFGSAWDGASAYVGVLALGEVFNFSLIPAVDVVRVLGTPRQLVRTRMWTAGVLVVVSLAFGALYGAEGVVWASLAVRVVSAYVWWSLAMRLTRSDAAEGVPAG